MNILAEKFKTVDKVIDETGISYKELGIKTKILFLLLTIQDQINFIDQVLEKGVDDVYWILEEFRNRRIDETRYKNREDFVSNYNENKLTSLQRLFQEPFIEEMLFKVGDIDPKRLYALHIQEPYIKFYLFALYVQ